jgi:hypothetical protein
VILTKVTKKEKIAYSPPLKSAEKGMEVLPAD